MTTLPRGPRSTGSRYSSQVERLLYAMLCTIEEDGTVLRHKLRTKTIGWLRAKDFDLLIAEAGFITYRRKKPSSGRKEKFYLGSEVVRKVAEITRERANQLEAASKEFTGGKPWMNNRYITS